MHWYTDNQTKTTKKQIRKKKHKITKHAQSGVSDKHKTLKRKLAYDRRQTELGLVDFTTFDQKRIEPRPTLWCQELARGSSTRTNYP